MTNLRGPGRVLLQTLKRNFGAKSTRLRNASRPVLPLSRRRFPLVTTVRMAPSLSETAIWDLTAFRPQC